ncbi:MAG: hypothetical protein EB127_30410, partial [Alphaproteobacteria bacterium]|nr:hypothetical protein [Alphaproteobacteria bacterium]
MCIRDSPKYAQFPGRLTFTLNGNTLYLTTDSYINLMTDADVDSSIDLVSDDSLPLLNFLVGHVYSRTSSLKLISTPQEQPKSAQDYNLSDYIGFCFSENFNYLLVNNFIITREDNILKFKPSGIDLEDAGLSDDGYLFCEKIGNADGTYNQIFGTKYFPISKRGNSDLKLDDNLTRVLTRKKIINESNEEVITTQIFDIYDSYHEAINSESLYACFLDREKGKFYFAKSSVELLPSESIDLELDNEILSTDQYTVIELTQTQYELFQDCGSVQIGESSPDEVVTFVKLPNRRIQISQTENNIPAICKIFPYEKLLPPDGEVYAFYTTVVGFQSQQKHLGKKFLSEEIKPWRWKNQKAIAVLSKNKVYPHK